ncbi:MAG: NAD(P)-dependent oxidoreductase [Enterocloster clostridioformis]
MGSGYDNVEVAYAKKKGIRVLNAPRSVVDSTAEMTIGLMMSVCRGIVQYDRELRKDRVCTRQLFFHRDMVLNGKTLGVIGFGRIGREVARKAYGLGMRNCLLYQPVPAPDEAVRACGAKAVGLDELLETSDVVTIHIPYTKRNPSLHRHGEGWGI